MALNNLTYFELDGGTSENPLVLTPSQVSGLIALSNKAGCTSDIRGYVTTESGTIPSYQKYLLNQRYPNLIISASTVSDNFSVTFENGDIASEMTEGSSKRFIVNNIDLAALEHRIIHNNFSSSDGMSQSTVEGRIRVAGDTIVCDAPSENLSWRDDITIEFYPSYDTSNIRRLNVTIQAYKISTIDLTYENELGRNISTSIVVTPNPIYTTKLNGLDIRAHSWTSIDPTERVINNSNIHKVDNSIRIDYTTPGSLCTASIRVRAYMYNNTSAPFETKVASIDVISPNLKAIVRIDNQTVDTQTTDYYITVTDPLENIHLLENGETLDIGYNGIGQDYRLSANNADLEAGYSKELGYYNDLDNKVQSNIVTGKNGTRRIFLDYTTKPVDIYVIYASGHYQDIDTVIQNGAIPSGETLEAFGIASEISTFAYNINNQYAIGGVEWRYMQQGTPKLSDRRGIDRVSRYNQSLLDHVNSYIWQKPNSNENYIGYYGDPAEVILFYDNASGRSKINNLLEILNMGSYKIDFSVSYCWLTYFANAEYYTVYAIRPSNKVIKPEYYANGNVHLVLYNWTPDLNYKLD